MSAIKLFKFFIGSSEFKFKAINVTVGLPFIKVTPDHGPNQEMIGKNISDPSSIIYAFKFLNKINDF